MRCAQNKQHQVKRELSEIQREKKNERKPNQIKKGERKYSTSPETKSDGKKSVQSIYLALVFRFGQKTKAIATEKKRSEAKIANANQSTMTASEHQNRELIAKYIRSHTYTHTHSHWHTYYRITKSECIALSIWLLFLFRLFLLLPFQTAAKYSIALLLVILSFRFIFSVGEAKNSMHQYSVTHSNGIQMSCVSTISHSPRRKYWI